MSLKFCAHANTQAYLYRTMASGSGGGRWSGRWTDDPRKMAASHWGREDRTDRIWQKVYAAEEREHNTKNDLMKSQMALEAALITFPMHFSHVVLMKYLSQATKVLLSEANTALDEGKKVRQELETALDAVTQAKDKAAIENKAALDAANKEIEKRGESTAALKRGCYDRDQTLKSKDELLQHLKGDIAAMEKQKGAREGQIKDGSQDRIISWDPYLCPSLATLQALKQKVTELETQNKVLTEQNQQYKARWHR